MQNQVTVKNDAIKKLNTNANSTEIKKDYTVFKTYFIYFISVLLFATVRILSSFASKLNLNPFFSSAFFTFIIQGVIMLGLPALLYFVLFKNKTPKDLLQVSQVQKVKPKVVGISILLGIVVFFLNIIVSTVFNLILNFFGYRSGGGSAGGFTQVGNPVLMFLFEIVLVAVMPAICEEFLHRGLLLGNTKNIGYKKAIIISSLLFGLIHFNINQFFYAFILGIVIAVVAVVAKSIWPAIIIHFINNAVSLYLSYAGANGWLGQNFYTHLQNFLQSQNVLLSLVATMMFIILVFSATSYLVVMLYKETTLKNVNVNLKSVFEHKSDSKFGTLTTQLEKQIVASEILFEKSNMNLKVNQKTSIVDIILPINRNVFKTTLFDNSFLIGALVISGLSTIFTFIWGLVW